MLQVEAAGRLCSAFARDVFKRGTNLAVSDPVDEVCREALLNKAIACAIVDLFCPPEPPAP